MLCAPSEIVKALTIAHLETYLSRQPEKVGCTSSGAHLAFGVLSFWGSCLLHIDGLSFSLLTMQSLASILVLFFLWKSCLSKWSEASFWVLLLLLCWSTSNFEAWLGVSCTTSFSMVILYLGILFVPYSPLPLMRVSGSSFSIASPSLNCRCIAVWWVERTSNLYLGGSLTSPCAWVQCLPLHSCCCGCVGLGCVHRSYPRNFC